MSPPSLLDPGLIEIYGMPDESKQRRRRAGNVRKLRECARLPSGKSKIVFLAITREFQNFLPVS